RHDPSYGLQRVRPHPEDQPQRRPRPLAEGVQRGDGRRRAEKGRGVWHFRRDRQRARGRSAVGRGHDVHRARSARHQGRKGPRCPRQPAGSRGVPGQAGEGNRRKVVIRKRTAESQSPQRETTETGPESQISGPARFGDSTMKHKLLSDFSLWFFSLCSLCLCGSFLSAASPALNAVNPRGGQRGTEVALSFTGGRLTDAKEVHVYYPGITVTKLEVVNDATLKVTVKIAPDCRLGEHCFRVRCASGVTEMRTFWVGALPIVDEKEPNGDFAAPQKIPLNSTVHGVVDNEDVDYYAVEAKKGQRISVEIEGMRLGNTMFDPYIAILDTKRFELATSDDAPLL